MKKVLVGRNLFNPTPTSVPSTRAFVAQFRNVRFPVPIRSINQEDACLSYKAGRLPWGEGQHQQGML
jgi:hypothetical protein